MFNSYELIQKSRPFSIDSLEDYGDILQYLLPWAALLTLALHGNSEAAWTWVYAGSATTILTHLLKFLFNFTTLGKRPNGHGASFPSGHTSIAFMGAVFFHFYVGIYWAIIPYLLAALTAYSRVSAKKHWIRDVIAGAVLGIFVTYLAFIMND